MPRVVVTVFAPDRRLELAVPDEVPVERLLPEIAEVFAADRDARWELTPRGGEPLRPDRSLTESGVFQGAVLMLVSPAASPSPLAGQGRRGGWDRAGVAVQNGAAAPAPPIGPPAAVAPAPPPPHPTVPREGGGSRAPYRFPTGPPAGARPVVDLLVVGGPSAGLRVPLPPGEHRVGSHRYSRVVLDDPTLSRVHLVVTVGAGGEVTVADAGSELGSLLEGVPLAGPARVLPGRVVAAGRSLIAFAPPGGAAPTVPPPAHPVAGAVRLDPPPRQPPARWPLALAAAGLPALLGLAGFLATLHPAWLLFIVLAPPAAAAEPLFRLSAYRGATLGYRDRLARLDGDLAAARSAEAARLRAGSPDAPRVLELGRSGAGRPARRADRPDWLQLRVGWADVAWGLGLDMPPGGDQVLRQQAAWTLARHQVLCGVPALVSLRDAGGLAVAGEPDQVAALCRWLGIQLATLHGADDLRLAAAVPAGGRDRWSWLEWLPHAGRHPGLPGAGGLAAGPDARSLVEGLAALVDARQPAAAGGREPGPAVVAFLDEAADLPRGALPGLLLRGPGAGVHVVWTGRDARLAPAECGVVVDVPAGRQQPTLSWRRRGVVYRLGGADGLPVRLALEAARALGGRSAFPPRVELGDLLGLAGDAERHVLESWIRDRSTAGRPLAAVVGLGGGGRPLAVDLQAAGHLVIGGAPGSGKSELLRCLVASLAVRHAPSALALALIDPRGALGACADLPHVVGHVGGPGDGACRQALAWLEGELSRRGAVLRQAGCGSLEELQRAAPQRAPARLVVLVDQAEELLAHAPHAAPSLVEAARAGRRLGVHLVLATCQPGQVAAVPGPRVALRCDDEGTSEALVGSGEAGRGGLPAGRGLLCAAPGHLAEFQGAAAPDQRLRRLVDAVARVHERLSVRSGTAG